MIRIEDLVVESDEEIQKEYDDWLEQGRNKIIEVNDRIIKFQEKAEKSDGSKKRKYQFLVEVNQLHLSEMISALKHGEFLVEDMGRELPYRDLFPARTPFGIWSLEFDDFDWRCKINFLKMPISKYKEMEDLYNSTDDKDKQKYLQNFREYIKKYEICENIKKMIEMTYVSKNRKDVIYDAIELYEKGRYLSFVNLAAIQIEGLFNDYLKELGTKKEPQSILPKLELLRKEAQVWGYVYYAFEFPDIRNKIAHGYILDKDLEEKSMDFLADIYNVLDSILNAESLNNKIIIFLRDYLNKEDKVCLFLEQWLRIEKELCKEKHSYKYGELFKQLKQGDFQDRIIWEELEEELAEFIKLFNRQEFWDELLVEDYDIYMGILNEFFYSNKDNIEKNYYETFKKYEKGAKERVKEYFGKNGENDWKKFYLPH